MAIDVGDDYEDEAEAEPAELDAAAGVDCFPTQGPHSTALSP